ncbi:MAG: 3-methyladenine DNA glycosylase [Gemmataceae bacterium]
MYQLPETDWREQREQYLARVRPLAADRVARSGRKHPVYDFLFEYYSYRAAHLLRWSPGVNVILDGATVADTDWPHLFRDCNGGIVLPLEAFPEQRRPYLCWAIDYLQAVGDREPQFGCFGLHEWAMVYRTTDVRHSRVPLRIAAEPVVESLPLRCSHYDAFRFFTQAAVPLNRTALTRETTADHDQPGCVHVNMDLYKFAYKLAPWVSSAVLAEAFAVAVAARELDMRASPYDLSGYGFTPIRIETKDGREEYVEGQRAVWRMGVPVRARLLAEYRRLEEPRPRGSGD